jgi:hypothetical protein
MSLKALNDYLESLIIQMGTVMCLLGVAWVDLKMLENGLNSKEFSPITIGYLISASAFHLFWAGWLTVLTFKKKAGE